MATINSDSREAMPYFKQALNSLNLAPYKVLKHLMLHLQRVSERYTYYHFPMSFMVFSHFHNMKPHQFFFTGANTQE